MFKTFTITMFVAATAIINAAPAFAEPVAVSNVSIVSTAGINLSSVAGRAELDHRLVAAAYEVCGNPSDLDLAGKNRARDCRHEVLAEARAAGAQLASRGSSIQIAAAR
jgi:UrcA family protein